MNRLIWLVYGAAAIMIAWTGKYFAVYLQRWEWMRALVAGELLLIGLLVLIAVVLVNRLSRLDRKITDLSEKLDNQATAPSSPAAGRPADGGGGVVWKGAVVPHVAAWAAGEAAARAAGNGSAAPYGSPARLAENARPASRGGQRFLWMSADHTDRYGVFIPVLLGAGVAVTALAAVVERAASAWMRRGGRASRNDAPRIPSDGVLAGAADLPEKTPPSHPLRKLTIATAAIVAAVIAGSMGTDLLADQTQDRPDPPSAANSTTTIVLRTETNAHRLPEDATKRLFEYCKGSTQPYRRYSALVPLGADRWAVVTNPALGEHAMRRFEGCLRDGIVDHARFDIQSIKHS